MNQDLLSANPKESGISAGCLACGGPLSPIADVHNPADKAAVEKQSDSPLSALTTALLRLYLAFAGASAIMLLWLLLRVLSYHLASKGFVLIPPPTLLLVAPIILMFAAKIAAAFAYQRDVRASQRSL